MVVLNEKDADRIASYLRRKLKELDEEISFARRIQKNIESSGECLKLGEVANECNNRLLVECKARKAEIAELIALLMTGSEE